MEVCRRNYEIYGNVNASIIVHRVKRKGVSVSTLTQLINVKMGHGSIFLLGNWCTDHGNITKGCAYRIPGGRCND